MKSMLVAVTGAATEHGGLGRKLASPTHHGAGPAVIVSVKFITKTTAQRKPP